MYWWKQGESENLSVPGYEGEEEVGGETGRDDAIGPLVPFAEGLQRLDGA